MKKYYSTFCQWLIKKINIFLMSKSWKAALAEAKEMAAGTNKKVWIILLHGEFVAIPKHDFKILWQLNPKMKCKTIAQWQKTVYEFKPDSR